MNGSAHSADLVSMWCFSILRINKYIHIYVYVYMYIYVYIYVYMYISGQIITTSAEVTLNGGLIRELRPNPPNSGLGIILICLLYIYIWSPPKPTNMHFTGISLCIYSCFVHILFFFENEVCPVLTGIPQVRAYPSLPTSLGYSRYLHGLQVSLHLEKSQVW